MLLEQCAKEQDTAGKLEADVQDSSVNLLK